jgi:hypothetical protein
MHMIDQSDDGRSAPSGDERAMRRRTVQWTNEPIARAKRELDKNGT